MPGIAERHLYKAGGGLRNFQHLIFGSDADTDYFAAQLTGAPLTGLAVGDKLTLVATGFPVPRAGTVKVITNASAATRELTLRWHMEDQFGNYITEDFTTSNAASQTRVALGALVGAKVRVIEVVAISGFVGGDSIDVGCDVEVSGQLAPEDIIYGLPLHVAGIQDIRSTVVLDAGVFSGTVDGTALTLVPGVHGVKIPSGVAPDSGDNRLVIITGRTSI